MQIDYKLAWKIKAGNLRRMVAYLIDVMICFAPGEFFRSWGGRSGDELFTSTALWLTFFGTIYFVFRDSGDMGRGIGKRIMRLNVISLKSGYRPSIKQSIKRNAYWISESILTDLMRSGSAITTLIFIWFIAEIAVLLTKKEGRRLGDMFGGTMVVLTENWLHFTKLEMMKDSTQPVEYQTKPLELSDETQSDDEKNLNNN